MRNTYATISSQSCCRFNRWFTCCPCLLSAGGGGRHGDTATAALSREVALSRGTHACGMWQTRAGRWDNQRRLGRIGLFVVAPLAGRRTTYLRPGLAMPRPRAASGVQLCSARWTVAIDRPAAVGIGGSIKLGSNTVVLLLGRGNFSRPSPVLRPAFEFLETAPGFAAMP